MWSTPLLRLQRCCRLPGCCWLCLDSDQPCRVTLHYRWLSSSQRRCSRAARLPRWRLLHDRRLVTRLPRQREWRVQGCLQAGLRVGCTLPPRKAPHGVCCRGLALGRGLAWREGQRANAWAQLSLHRQIGMPGANNCKHTAIHHFHTKLTLHRPAALTRVRTLRQNRPLAGSCTKSAARASAAPGPSQRCSSPPVSSPASAAACSAACSTRIAGKQAVRFQEAACGPQ